MPGRVNGFSLAYTAMGGVVLWSGIKGTTLSTTFRGLMSGKAPAVNQQPVSTAAAAASPAAGGNLLDTGTSIPGITAAGLPAASGSNQSVLRMVAAQHGWTGTEWTDLYNIEMAEAGFSLTAQNPSGAYGMAQFINGPSEYAQYGGNSTTALGQATGMCNYIEQRYGTPSVAWAFHLANGYY
jgi:hypothetical protein